MTLAYAEVGFQSKRLTEYSEVYGEADSVLLFLVIRIKRYLLFIVVSTIKLSVLAKTRPGKWSTTNAAL